MTRLNKILMAGSALGLALAVMGAPSAHASVVPAFDFNLGNAPGGYGASDIPNVYDLQLSDGNSVITQTLAGGSPDGQAFTDVGTIFVTGYQLAPNGAGGNGLLSTGSLVAGVPPSPSTGGLGTATSLYITYNLQGTVNGSGNPVFSGGTASLTLGSTVIATFVDVPGTGGTALISLGGIPSGTFQITFKMSPPDSPTNSLFTSTGGADLDSLTLQLSNIQPVSANVGPCTPSAPLTCEAIDVTDTGSISLTPIPEPASLALFGSGLLGLGLLSRRRWRKGDRQI